MADVESRIAPYLLASQSGLSRRQLRGILETVYRLGYADARAADAPGWEDEITAVAPYAGDLGSGPPADESGE